MQNNGYEDLAGDISLIDTGLDRPRMAACYLLRAGEEVAFIDTGTANTLPGVLGVLAQKGIDPAQVSYVIPTHVHLDHAGGAGSMMQAFPNASLVVHPRGARHMVDPSQLIEGVKAVYGEAGFRQKFREVIPVPEDRVIPAADGFILTIGHRELEFIDTPGHARHHFCVHDPLSSSIFTGDTFGLSYREFDVDNEPFIFATTTPVQFEPDAWMRSLDRLMSRNPSRFLLTHYGEIEANNHNLSKLKRSIDDFVAIAERHRDAGIKRIQMIKKEMLARLLEDLRQHGCSLDTEQCKALLDGDIELNAQGLEIWLKRQEA